MRTTLLWGAIGFSSAVFAAGITPVAIAPRSVEDLPRLAWAFLFGCALVGWMIGSLKPAVIALNDSTQARSVNIAGVIQALAASLAFGIGCGLWTLTAATYADKPVPSLYGYLAALFGGYMGMKGMEFVTELGKGFLERWAAKQQNKET